jgi:hypothetical protein
MDRYKAHMEGCEIQINIQKDSRKTVKGREYLGQSSMDGRILLKWIKIERKHEDWNNLSQDRNQ